MACETWFHTKCLDEKKEPELIQLVQIGSLVKGVDEDLITVASHPIRRGGEIYGLTGNGSCQILARRLLKGESGVFDTTWRDQFDQFDKQYVNRLCDPSTSVTYYTCPSCKKVI